MPATQADLDQLDAILDRLDDHTRAHPDPALDAIADDLTAWYRRMFRPAPPDDRPAADRWVVALVAISAAVTLLGLAYLLAELLAPELPPPPAG